MKNLILLLFVPFVCFGQTFNDYKYIKLVSNDYGIDIMSIATEVFYQKGFIVLDDNSNLPNDLKESPCNILTGKIRYKRGITGWTSSKLTLSLLDCNNKVIYRKKSYNTTNFNQPDVLNNFIKATNGIPPRKRISNQITNTDGSWIGNGSGLIISKLGHIITNHHVIDDADDIEVEFILDEEVQIQIEYLMPILGATWTAELHSGDGPDCEDTLLR